MTRKNNGPNERNANLTIQPKNRISPLVEYWCLRLLLVKRGRLLQLRSGPKGALASFCTEIGVPESTLKRDVALFIWLQARLDQLSAMHPRFGGHVGRNLAYVGHKLGLSAVEQEMLGFILLVKRDPVARDLIDAIYQKATEQAIAECFSIALDETTQRISLYMKRSSRLFRSGLISFGMTMSHPMMIRFPTVVGLSDAVCSEYFDLESLFAEVIVRARPSQLRLDDFDHVEVERRIIERYLAQALASSRHGANVLVSGPPGTGKTELCRLLAMELGAEAWEISSSLYQAEQRINSLRLAQESLASTPKSLIIFDEIEDIFGRSQGLGYSEKQDHSKAWMNERLTENPVPTIWITNSIARIDPAHLRRFDLLIEMPQASRYLRERLVREKLPKSLRETALARQLVEDRESTLADLAVVGRLAETLRTESKPEALATEVSQALAHRHRILRGRLPHRGSSASEHYNLNWLNTDQAIEPIFQGLKRSQKGRVLLYGPPGTGKTAFAGRLAQELDCPLLRKSVAQLQSCWVGETEKNIAKLFEQGTREQAVVMLDEADSLLRDRQTARTSWEVSQTNEILQQMEDFDGIFIAATNRMEQIEPAAMRRFDWRVELDWLRPEQVLGLARETLSRHGSLAPTDDDARVLGRISPVAPGDFKVAERQAEVLGQSLTAEALIEVLRSEASRRTKDGDGIGFLAEVS